MRRGGSASQALSADELRTVVTEAGALIPQRHRQMLLSILDLERITVNDIMIPRQEISAIDISVSWDDILNRLRQTPHSRLPVYDGELDKLIGILHMKRVAQELARGTLSRFKTLQAAREALDGERFVVDEVCAQRRRFHSHHSAGNSKLTTFRLSR